MMSSFEVSKFTNFGHKRHKRTKVYIHRQQASHTEVSEQNSTELYQTVDSESL